MRALAVLRKTVGDVSHPKLLAAYFVPFLVVASFLGLAMANNELSGAGAPLVQQETELFVSFLTLSYFWAAGIPVLALGAVLPANTLAREAETGTLRILLSKPVRRWQVLVGTFGAVVGYATLVALASLLLSAVLLVELGDVSAAAIPAGVFAAMPGNVAFALFSASVAAAIGVAASVVTRNRLRAALLALVVPTLHFAFFPIRLLSGEMYEDYYLYLLDVNHHFANAFVVVHEALGGDLDAETQLAMAIWGGVYEVPEETERLPASLEPVDLVSMEASLLGLAAVAALALVVAGYRFQRLDV